MWLTTELTYSNQNKLLQVTSWNFIVVTQKTEKASKGFQDSTRRQDTICSDVKLDGRDWLLKLA